LSGPNGRFPATKLEVVAVATAWQGRRFEEGAVDRPRVSDVVMSAVMTDVSARVPPRDARVFAVVHEENSRSLALCRRYGLVLEMTRPDPSYRRLVTDHRPPKEPRRSSSRPTTRTNAASCSAATMAPHTCVTLLADITSPVYIRSPVAQCSASSPPLD